MLATNERKNLKLLDPETLSRIKNLSVRARYIVEGYLTGLHRSPFHGFSVEFTEHREYHPGDPLRHLDWKVLAKRDKYYIKRYEEETNLRAMFLLDTSASMDFGTNSLTKLEYAKTCAAGLSYLMHQQRDRFGLITFHNDIDILLTPKSGKQHFHQFIQALEETHPGNKTDALNSFRNMMNHLHKRSLVILFTDFLNDRDNFLSGLKKLRSRHLEVIVFHIMDPAEWDIPYNEHASFRGPEDNYTFTTNPYFFRKHYKSVIKAFCSRVQQKCTELAIDYSRIITDTPLSQALTSYLTARQTEK